MNESFYSVLDIGGTAFPHVTESWFLIWQGIPLPMPYDDHFTRYVMPNILRKMVEKSEGHEVGGPTEQDYSFLWEMKWKDNKIEITADWLSPPCRSEIHVLLQSECSTLTLSLDDFLAEWKMLLRKYIEIYDKLNKEFHINLLYPDSYFELKDLVSLIPKYGLLYEEFNSPAI